MDEEPKITVTCGACEVILPSVQAGQSDDLPCPRCGSTQKKIDMQIVDRVGVRALDSIRGKIKDPNLPSKKNPRVDFSSGADLRKSDGKWMSKERVIDRDNDFYKEVVVDPETGEVVHHNEEPLSKHFGHGSAKFKKNESES